MCVLFAWPESPVTCEGLPVGTGNQMLGGMKLLGSKLAERMIVKVGIFPRKCKTLRRLEAHASSNEAQKRYARRLFNFVIPLAESL